MCERVREREGGRGRRRWPRTMTRESRWAERPAAMAICCRAWLRRCPTLVSVAVSFSLPFGHRFFTLYTVVSNERSTLVRVALWTTPQTTKDKRGKQMQCNLTGRSEKAISDGCRRKALSHGWWTPATVKHGPPLVHEDRVNGLDWQSLVSSHFGDRPATDALRVGHYGLRAHRP